MARVAYLKERVYHDVWLGSGKFVDVYDNKEGFDGEMALCVQLKDGVTGYVPLTENSIRGGHIKTIGADGKKYSLAVQKKNIYNDIAYCKVTTNSGSSPYVTVGSNYVQISLSGIKTTASSSIKFDFYDANDNKITDYKNYIEDDVAIGILINAYITVSGSGNGYNFKGLGNELLSSIGSYTNRDLEVHTKFNNTKSSESIGFFISGSTPNTGNFIVNKITFKRVTINGRNIPIRLS